MDPHGIVGRQDVIPIVGFTVAGGASRRMGRDKAALPWRSGTLLDHAIARLRGITPDVRILCGPAPRYTGLGLPVVVDAAPGLGPIGGLAAALATLGGGQAALLLAVDLPFISVALLEKLAADGDRWDAVVPLSSDGPEPLCALYRWECAAPVARRIAAADLKMTSFWPDVRVRTLTAVDLEGLGDVDTLFTNVNTPEDYDVAGD